MSNPIAASFLAALNAVQGEPRPIMPRARMEATDRGCDGEVTLEWLAAHLRMSANTDGLRSKLHLLLGKWDAVEGAEWTVKTDPRTPQRRAVIYRRLQFEEIADVLNDLMQVSELASVVIAADRVGPWYPPEYLPARTFYWPHYENYLIEQHGWHPESVAKLGEATSWVVERLAPPTEPSEYASRGLVVGHVQSGKTANFTGAIAKAIDAGYRLVIVLTGTIEILRRQTQRRLDMELVGIENITYGLPKNDPSLIGKVEYLDDPAWDANAWVSHGVRPSTIGFPDILRLTTRDSDYKGLAQGISTLHLHKADKTLPLYDPTNLFSSDALIAVVKKQTQRLDALLADLKFVAGQLRELPVIILDDESDQASINTTNPKKWAQGQRERTAINERISQLLRLFPRGQYVAYTATPFANVFVDPGDSESIFPRDFIVSLEPPLGYMGITSFHDLGDRRPKKERPYRESNERCHVRDLTGSTPPERLAELGKAIDAFVLTGALKLHREMALGQPGLFHHHTMLIHESVKQQEHRQLAEEVQELWNVAEFTTGAGISRLRRLWEEDFDPVSRVRGDYHASIATGFDEVKPHIAEAVARITPAGAVPYIIVNGDKDIEREDVAFDRRSVWRILIGGMSLSRGFTVEGLTISYYRRRTSSADTLMQMGRWFGFRPNYGDLVRLYIGRNEPDKNGRTIDLYKLYEGLALDEQDFRQELVQYAEKVEGEFALTPLEVPPLVSQHLPYLPPTSKNKMYNAELDVRRFAITGEEPNAWSDRPDAIGRNYDRLLPIAAVAREEVTAGLRGGQTQRFLAGVASHEAVVEAFQHIEWLFDGHWKANLAYLLELRATRRLDDWLVLLPQSTNPSRARRLPGLGTRTLYKRSRREDRKNIFGYISESADRNLIRAFANDPASVDGLDAFNAATRGALLCYPIYEGDERPPQDDDRLREAIIFAPYLVTPPSAVPPGGALVRFRVKDSSRAADPIIPKA